MTSEYLMVVVEALHTVVTKVSQEEGRLLMSIMALSSSLIVVPCDVIWEIILSYSLRCAFHLQIVEAPDQIHLR